MAVFPAGAGAAITVFDVRAPRNVWTPSRLVRFVDSARRAIPVAAAVERNSDLTPDEAPVALAADGDDPAIVSATPARPRKESAGLGSSPTC